MDKNQKGNTGYVSYVHELLAFGLINSTALAQKMWPNLSAKVAYNKLYNKMNGLNGQKITDSDIDLVKKVCSSLKQFI